MQATPALMHPGGVLGAEMTATPDGFTPRTLQMAPWPGEDGGIAGGAGAARLLRERALAEAERAVVHDLVE